MNKGLQILLFIVGVVLIAGIYFYFRRSGSGRDMRVVEWIKNPGGHPEWSITALQRCGQAPFIQPSNGLIGYLWDDSFRPGHRHQGIDIFGPDEAGKTPVYAAYDGYLTRLPDWKSSLIIRIPNDPLQPGRQIWTYYTHMADAEGNSFISSRFPPGAQEMAVKAGDLLGAQGNYSGNPGDPVGIHLHFSIVLDNGNGKFLNELDIKNTLDPSPYLGLNLNANTNSGEIPICLSYSGEK
jgi:peptidoglycan LD-endopeptidase LytH